VTYTPAYALAAEADDGDESGLGEWSAEASRELSPLKKQYQLLRFITREDGGALRIAAMLGGWGSAKTNGSAQAFLAGCILNPWRPEYGANNPRSAILAPTFRILKQSSIVQLDAVLPRELVMRRRGLPHNDILLTNGHLIELHSGAGELEGASYCGVWIDEIHHPNFEQRKYLNYQARARDPLAKRLFVIVSGLPETGWVRDTFDQPSSPSRLTLLNATRDNPHIKPEVIEEFLASCPSGEEERLLGGEWMPPVGAVYPQFDSATHVVERELRDAEPVHLAFDVGNFAAVVVGQEIPVTVRNIVGQPSTEKGLLIGAQYLPDNMSVDQVCYFLRTRTGHLVQPGVSIICVDPTTDRDELAAVRKHFPGVRIVRRERGDATYPIETGVRYVQRGLRDALGNTRLFFSRSLQGTARGILDSLSRMRRHEVTGEIVKDNLRDHVHDALRYMVCEVLPAERPRPVVVSGR